MSIESVMPSNHLLLLLPSIFPSNKVFSNKSVLCIRWPKYWSFSFSISPSNEYSGLTSFRRKDFFAGGQVLWKPSPWSAQRQQCYSRLAPASQPSWCISGFVLIEELMLLMKLPCLPEFLVWYHTWIIYCWGAQQTWIWRKFQGVLRSGTCRSGIFRASFETLP